MAPKRKANGDSVGGSQADEFAKPSDDTKESSAEFPKLTSSQTLACSWLRIVIPPPLPVIAVRPSSSASGVGDPVPNGGSEPRTGGTESQALGAGEDCLQGEREAAVDRSRGSSSGRGMKV
uniref:Uncharacterized protein n=1 Tax=Setaria viridis TaxID=4556 RepID=A0A4U6TAW1_SETVI|nr:hypothetical protein SEVIR_8G024000v2 [Setaria viridis]